MRAIQHIRRSVVCPLLCAAVNLVVALGAAAQATPIAIVPVEGVQLIGALNVTDGKAIIATSGSITAGERTATVTLPHRGNLQVCATTQVTLTSDSSVLATSPNETPGLMMSLARGALEANFATGKNSDVILTPDFRILISGPGTAQVRVRLEAKGDTCVDNRGPNAPYVTVSSVFDGGAYRVQPDQRVMFQHGSLREVVDNEKESCGCPPASKPSSDENAFPVAESEGLAPAPPPSQNAASPGTTVAQVTDQFSYDGTKPKPVQPAMEKSAPEPVSQPTLRQPVAAVEKRQGLFTRMGHFFRRIFGG